MSASGYGAAADHAALSGLTVGDPHTQYAGWLQGTFAQRPAQPVRQGQQYLATDSGIMYVSNGSAWLVLQQPGAAGQGTRAERGTASAAGSGATFWATDEKVLYRSDGAVWEPITEQPTTRQFARLFLAGG